MKTPIKHIRELSPGKKSPKGSILGIVLAMAIIWASSTVNVLIAQYPNHRQKTLVGGPCEGCEAVFEYEKELHSIDTLPDLDEKGIPLRISGTVYLPDGKTPAPEVILYLYHTNPQGIYATKGDETGWAKRHGYIRGWVKTDKEGHYTFYTLKPGAYPSRTIPAHIHVTILEPDGRYYWVGSYHFAGDSLLTEAEKNPEDPRCGSTGLMVLEREGEMWTGTRDFILGRNVPGYN